MIRHNLKYPEMTYIYAKKNVKSEELCYEDYNKIVRRKC